MNNKIFKAGDLVYYPLMSDKILTLLKHDEVIPLDTHTGKIIVDYREGKLELEDE